MLKEEENYKNGNFVSKFGHLFIFARKVPLKRIQEFVDFYQTVYENN